MALKLLATMTLHLMSQVGNVHCGSCGNCSFTTNLTGVTCIIVGSTAKTDKCIPFVSQYTDCTEDNLCSGCQKCVCLGNGEWSCGSVKQCPSDEDPTLSFVDDNMMDEAMYKILGGLQKGKRDADSNSKTPLVPRPPSKEDDLLLDIHQKYGAIDIDKEIIKLIKRKKRSTKKEKSKQSTGVKFYHTVDEINEDTLNNENSTGTLQAKKILNLSKLARRSGPINSNNLTQNESLHIVFNDPKQYDSHIAENKIDTSNHLDEKTFISNKIHGVVGNQTKKQKDKELSKLIVNELNNGTETVGDFNAPIMSNVTFTAENDTLTAMALIAGNLLNQLWNMEKDTSEESEEIESLKHQKISDLLELFKEPLNLRQENFLKNALQHLSEAIDKDKINKNFSLCDKIEETKDILNDSSDESFEKNNKSSQYGNQKETGDSETSKETQQATTSKAILKINNALNLINKYQHIHTKLNELKRKENTSKEIKFPPKIALNDDESASLNIFGKILEKVTKLLLPPKKSNKMIKHIKNLNVLGNVNNDAPSAIYLHGVDMKNLTTKDKVVLDYLNLVNKNPKCLVDMLKAIPKSYPEIKGDILLNLSEYLKIKSLMDLIRLLEPEKQNIRNSDKNLQVEITTTTETTTTNKPSDKFLITKAKLKAHLTSIINDLKELQETRGGSVSNFSLADTLPCIYNLLKNDNPVTYKSKNHVSTSPSDKIMAIFKSLKGDLQSTSYRRSNIMINSRPKSSIVWERIIKNVNGEDKKYTRRTYNREPKSFENLRKQIDVIESGSKTYKNQILQNGAPPQKQLTLLKALNEETKKIISTLEGINVLLGNFKDLPVDQQNEVEDFLHNAAMDINMNTKISETLNKTKFKPKVNDHVELIRSLTKNNKASDRDTQKHLGMSDALREINVPMKLSRNEIINQLIKNRMQFYIREKESKRLDLRNDINYRIAKKILLNLEIGNEGLAKEMYKYLIMQRANLRDDLSLTGRASVSSLIGDSRPAKLEKESHFPETQRGSSGNDWANKDAWLRQLMDLKNI